MQFLRKETVGVALVDKSAASANEDGVHAPIRLKLLGEPRFTFETEGDVTPRSKRARALVAFLAMARDHSAPRARLADLFWGDRGEVQARGSLRQCLLEVRAAAGQLGVEFLKSDRESVSLGANWTSDIQEIEALLQSDSAAKVADAFERAGREMLLNGLYVSDEFDEWQTVVRAEIDAKFAEAARRGLRRAIETGADDAARRIADSYLLRDPGDEEVTVLAMHADARRGAAPVAHRRFQKLRDYLAAELGAGPSKAAYEALAAIARQDDQPRSEVISTPEAVSGPPVLIIGPFEESGFAVESRHISAGLREEVASGLSRFRDIRVLFEAAEPSVDDAVIYGDAVTAYVLTVALRQSLRGFRVTPVLTRLSDRTVVWSHQIALDRSDIQQAIDFIVDRIIGAVAPRIERDSVPVTQSEAVYDRYLRAKHFPFYPKSTHAEALKAVEELESIIAAAPSLTVAYGPLIRIYNTHYGYTIAGEDPAEPRARAFALAQTALALDRGHIHNYTVMGWCHLWRGNWDAARTLFQQALRLNPYHAERLKEAAFGLLFLGDHDECDSFLQRCLELDPLPNDNFFEDLGFLRLLQQKPAEASAYLDLIVDPSIIAEIFCVMAATATGRPTAKAAAQKWLGMVAAIWTSKCPMNEDNVVAWLRRFLPFRNADDWRIFEDYLRAALR